MRILKPLVAVLIVAVWGAVIIQGVVKGEFKGPVAEMTPVVLLAAGYLLGREVVENARNSMNRGQPGGEPPQDQQSGMLGMIQQLGGGAAPGPGDPGGGGDGGQQ